MYTYTRTYIYIYTYICVYLSNATCLMRPRLFYVFRRVKDRHNLLGYSQRWKKTCTRKAVLDKWFPLKHETLQPDTHEPVHKRAQPST